MRAGRLRRKIKVEQRLRTKDEGGGSVHGWETYCDGIYATIKAKSGSEGVDGDRLNGKVTHDIWLRLSSRTKGITNAHRLVDRKGEIYNIKSVQFDERGRDVIIMAQTGGRDE